MALKTCEYCGKVVAGIFTALRERDGLYVCPTCFNLAKGKLSISQNFTRAFCHSTAVVPGGRRFTTAGIILLVAGIILAAVIVGLILMLLRFYGER